MVNSAFLFTDKDNTYILQSYIVKILTWLTSMEFFLFFMVPTIQMYNSVNCLQRILLSISLISVSPSSNAVATDVPASKELIIEFCTSRKNWGDGILISETDGGINVKSFLHDIFLIFFLHFWE